ncbi:hypothetical protein BKA93DRAFT_309982 [Sparassis latifolia]
MNILFRSFFITATIAFAFTARLGTYLVCATPMFDDMRYMLWEEELASLLPYSIYAESTPSTVSSISAIIVFPSAVPDPTPGPPAIYSGITSVISPETHSTDVLSFEPVPSSIAGCHVDIAQSNGIGRLYAVGGTGLVVVTSIAALYLAL